jgi:hypothetical protein
MLQKILAHFRKIAVIKPLPAEAGSGLMRLTITKNLI